MRVKRAAPLMALAFMMPRAARAQKPLSSFNNLDLYGSFFEITNFYDFMPNSKVTLSCGYSVTGNAVTLDTNFGRLTKQPLKPNGLRPLTYASFQNKLILTSPDPVNNSRADFQLVEPDNSIKAKNCSVADMDKTGKPSDCKTTRPFLSLSNSLVGRQIGALCEKAFTEAKDFLTRQAPLNYSPRKAAQTQADLKNILAVLQQ